MEGYLLFVLMSILLIILPGPDTGLATQNTLAYGKKGGMKTVFGCTCGLILHTLAATLGLSAILVKSAYLFSIFKYIGAIYLIYLGLLALWSIRKKHTSLEENQKAEPLPEGISCFRQGFLTNVLNPKIAVFFLTFLPQFVEVGNPAFFQLFGLGLTYTLLTILWFKFYIYLINHIRVWMKKPSIQRVLQGLTGFVLVSFGIKLAFEKSP